MFILFHLVSGISGVSGVTSEISEVSRISGIVSGVSGIISRVVLNSINRVKSCYKLCKFYKIINSYHFLLLLFFSKIVTKCLS